MQLVNKMQSTGSFPCSNSKCNGTYNNHIIYTEEISSGFYHSILSKSVPVKLIALKIKTIQYEVIQLNTFTGKFMGEMCCKLFSQIKEETQIQNY